MANPTMKQPNLGKQFESKTLEVCNGCMKIATQESVMDIHTHCGDLMGLSFAEIVKLRNFLSGWIDAKRMRDYRTHRTNNNGT